MNGRKKRCFWENCKKTAESKEKSAVHTYTIVVFCRNHCKTKHQFKSFISGLAVDWKNRRLYFSNMGTIRLHSMSHSWHRLEMVSLTGKERRIIKESGDHPRSVWIDMENKYVSKNPSYFCNILNNWYFYRHLSFAVFAILVIAPK